MKVRLGDVGQVVTGTTPKSGCEEYWHGEYNWITPAEINDDSDVIFETDRMITDKAIKDSHLKSFPAGTVLLSSRAPIGKVAIAGTEMYCNQGFKNIICSERIYNRYYITVPISNFPRIYRIFLSDGRQAAKISASENFFYVSIGLLPDVLGVMDVSVVDCRRGITQHGGHQVDVLCF